MDEEVYKKIISKKEFSQLPKKDVEMAFLNFDKEVFLDEEKIKLTRDLLRKVFSAFISSKLLNLKDKDAEWFLKKHISTRERLSYYGEVYSRLLKGFKKVNVIDLGAGVNGFSYFYFKRRGFNVTYFATEAMGQLVDLMNYYFAKNKLAGKSYHLSLFELEKNKDLIKKIKGEKVVFLFKTLDSLEMLERNYSKRLLKEIVPLVDRVVVSFATRSLVSRKKFYVERKWLTEFIKENFNILDDFELGGERYLIFSS